MTQHTPEDATSATLRAHLAYHRITATALADQTGMSRSRLASRMAGRTPWRLDELRAVAEHLDLPVTALVDAQPEAGLSLRGGRR